MKALALAVLVALTPTALLAGKRAPPPADKTATFDYSGWHCARCGPRIETALRKTKAVKSATATLDRVTVVFDERFLDLEKLEAMIEGAGPYEVTAKKLVAPTPTPTPAASPTPPAP